jgi:hypothetical protein
MILKLILSIKNIIRIIIIIITKIKTNNIIIIIIVKVIITLKTSLNPVITPHHVLTLIL